MRGSINGLGLAALGCGGAIDTTGGPMRGASIT